MAYTTQMTWALRTSSSRWCLSFGPAAGIRLCCEYGKRGISFGRLASGVDNVGRYVFGCDLRRYGDLRDDMLYLWK